MQASRWDGMKDMAGVMEGFAHHVDPALRAHLVLAGPAVTGVADDPEAAQVYHDCIDRWRRLPHEARSRVHLACTPMADPDEAAAIVNALQRRATVVVQKSLAEGFGLTVAEAMWKVRPVVASAVGGIVDQIDHGEHGLLLDDPHDLGAFGSAVEELLRDPAEAARLGKAHVSVRPASSSATPTSDATRASWRGCSSNSARWFVPPSTPGTLAAFHRNGGLHCASHRKSGLNEQDYDPQL